MFFLIASDYDPHLDIRLVGGSIPSEGRLEVSFNGQWGSVCRDGWDINDATIACKHLGYPDALGVARQGDFPIGTGPIWIDEVDCDGVESSLFDCNYKGWGVKGCTHDKDVGIYCAPKSEYSPYTTYYTYICNTFIYAYLYIAIHV